MKLCLPGLDSTPCPVRGGVPGKHSGAAFTLIELLVTIAVIAILAGMLLPVLSKAKSSARRIQCVSNLRQISQAVLMYADDHGQTLPLRISQTPGVLRWFGFKSFTKSYAGLNEPSSPEDRLYSCPADRFFYNEEERFGPVPFVPSGLHEHPHSDYSSYMFNCGNLVTNAPNAQRFPGVGGWKVPQVATPTRTVLVAEFPAFIPFSWHQPRKMDARNYPFSDAQCVSSFVDGHVSSLKFFHDADLANGPESWHYDPPHGYEYRWSAD